MNFSVGNCGKAWYNSGMRYKHEDYALRRGIRETLAARGMTKAELCRRTRVCRSSLGSYLAGRGDLTGGQADALRVELGLVFVNPIDDDE